MNQQKYIRVSEFGSSTEVMILIPPMVNHARMAFSMGLSKDDVASAGFVRNGTEDGRHTVKCHGKSSSLGLECRPGDSTLVRRQHYAPFKEQKYVRFETLDGNEDVIVLIPNDIQHSELVNALRAKDRVVSAGFVETSVSDNERFQVQCYGESLSLDIPSREEEDTRLLERQHYEHFFQFEDRF